MCDDSTLPPLILHPGDSDSHEVKCLTVGHRLRSVPHSETSRNTEVGPDAVDLRQVDAGEPVQRRANIEGDRVGRLVLRRGAWATARTGISLSALQPRQGGLDLDVTLLDLALIEVVQRERLLERKECSG